MPAIKTEVTEIVTGLATLPYASVLDALDAEPRQMLNVESVHWAHLRDAASAPEHARTFSSSWANGKAFLSANDGLRGRTPLSIEWKGPHHPPGDDPLPADLRIDHVFIVSCKYMSKVLANPSPSHLFQRALASRGTRSEMDWYLCIAGIAYRRFYSRVREELMVQLPVDVEDLTDVDRSRIKELCVDRWPASLLDDYAEFSAEVSRRSAAAWREAVPRLVDQESLLWRILRFSSAPYFILGSSGSSNLRLRVATPWDWRQRYSLTTFLITEEQVGQPRVGWVAEVADRVASSTIEVRGHVEIRWSHGRFCGHPEAKLYLDTPHAQVPGYFALR